MRPLKQVEIDDTAEVTRLGLAAAAAQSWPVLHWFYVALKSFVHPPGPPKTVVTGRLVLILISAMCCF